jgi:uncharacterized membrane protein YbaN (DUF454 family)
MAPVPDQLDRDGLSPADARVLPRGALLVLGSFALVLAVIGLIMPLVPAMPFFIVAAACFARAHRPMHDWLLRQPWLGPALHDWHRHRALPFSTKVALVLATTCSFAVSILLLPLPGWLKWTIAAVALGIVALLWRIPTQATPTPRTDR